MRLRFRSIAAVAAFAFVVMSLPLAAPANSASADTPASPTFPSWAEVTQAKQTAAAAQAEYQKVSAAVTSLEQKVQQASTAELTAQYNYSVAKSALDEATQTADKLATELGSAKAAAQKAKTLYGEVVSQLYLNSGQDVTVQLLLSGTSSGQSLLRQLGTMSQLTEHGAGLKAQAEQASNTVASLSAEASAARQSRQQLANAAQTKLNAAQQAAAQVQAALAQQQQQSATLYAMAATLKNTAASEQQQYFQGLAQQEALARQRAAQAAQAAQAAAAASASSGSLYSISLSITPNPAAAQAYAQSQMAAHGWGASQFSCLVQLWNIESGWRVNAYNPAGGAYGIPQAYPGSKMATFGSDWMTNPVTQINWGLAYIQRSYSTPCGALSFETSHVPYWY